ncbi:MAG: bifunctional phosphoglucose/phosphomannose isomerase [Chloroflexi bacterium]|nr:bifunctional phosphoglucose/phosphomannose isomerase [Chloroflexota bacterium]
MLDDAWRDGGSQRVPVAYRDCTRLLFVGMGGSAAAGAMLAALMAADGSCIPVTSHRGYGVPAWVDEGTLVVAVSYSGDTEETLSAINEATRRGAMLLAVSHGGRVARMATDLGFPCLPVPVEAPPRCAFPAMFGTLLRQLVEMKLMMPIDDDLRLAVDVLDQLVGAISESVPMEENPAKRLASDLVGRFPVILASDHLVPVAERWKAQINENAKTIAMAEAIPEAHHNAIVALAHTSKGLVSERLHAVLLRDVEMPTRSSYRLGLTDDLLRDSGIPSSLMDFSGPSRVASVLAATLFGDYVSYYLALLQPVDPSVTGPIDRVKRALTEDARPAREPTFRLGPKA